MFTKVFTGNFLNINNQKGMDNVVLTENEMLNLWREDAHADNNGVVILEVVETSDIQDGGKYQSFDVIVREVATGKHYSYEITRSGSYFSHYEYEAYGDITEVEQVTRTQIITEWVQV